MVNMNADQECEYLEAVSDQFHNHADDEARCVPRDIGGQEACKFTGLLTDFNAALVEASVYPNAYRPTDQSLAYAPTIRM